MINFKPTICNICGGKVAHIPTSKIYEKNYGSGWLYRCTACGARVGTQKTNRFEALGILATNEMRYWKKKCRTEFDVLWKSGVLTRKIVISF